MGLAAATGGLARCLVIESRFEADSPYLCSYSLRHSHVYDYVDETYSFGPDGPELISTDAETARPKLQVFPVAI